MVAARHPKVPDNAPAPPTCPCCDDPVPAIYHPTGEWLPLCLDPTCSDFACYHSREDDGPSVPMDEALAYPHSGGQHHDHVQVFGTHVNEMAAIGDEVISVVEGKAGIDLADLDPLGRAIFCALVVKAAENGETPGRPAAKKARKRKRPKK